MVTEKFTGGFRGDLEEMAEFDAYTPQEVIGGRPPPKLGRCKVCGMPFEASLDGVVLSCVNRRDAKHRQGSFP